MARAYVGTSGWSYDHWRHGVFYPEGLPARKWLAFLAQRFDTVELNSPFYRVPRRTSVETWSATVGPDFPFAVKLWRAFTHYNRLEDPNGRLPSVLATLEPFKPGQRGPLLLQLPPQMKADVAKLDRFLRRLEPFGWDLCVEFRNATWLTPGVRRVLDDRAAALCVHDMQWAAPVTDPNDGASFVYVRRHGPDSRYGGSYSDRQVRADAAAIEGWVAGGRRVYVYYNNDGQGNAVRDGARLKAALGQGVPDVPGVAAAPVKRPAARRRAAPRPEAARARPRARARPPSP